MAMFSHHPGDNALHQRREYIIYLRTKGKLTYNGAKLVWGKKYSSERVWRLANSLLDKADYDEINYMAEDIGDDKDD